MTEHQKSDPPEVTRSEEQLRLRRRVRDSGVARLRKWVDEQEVRERVPLQAEGARVEIRAVDDPTADSGEIEQLGDGLISVPLFSEELELVKRTVVRERAILRIEWQDAGDAEVRDTLRRERVELEVEDRPEA